MTNLLKHLNFTDYELLVPKRKLKEKRKGVFVEVIKTMFPGYVLIKTNNVWDIFNKTRHLNSIYKFLHSNDMFCVLIDKLNDMLLSIIR